MPKHLCWPVLRLVLAGHDYAAIKGTWTLGMVVRANEAMDLQEEANRAAQERARAGQGR